MREIKFRGKRIDNGEWAVGCLISYSEKESVIVVNVATGEVHWVFSETVGQYTGLKDKNKKEICEGDIVDNGHTVIYTSSAHQFHYIGIVKFDVKQGCLVIHNTDGNTKRLTAKTVQTNKIKVLGNIYDNPELLEVQE